MFSALDSRSLLSVRLQELIRRNTKRDSNFFKIVDRNISSLAFDMSYERSVKPCFKS